MKFPSVKDNPSLSERVSGMIEEAILNGRFPVSSRLPTEAELAEMFEVSRTVIREALQKLKASGLIRSKTGSGNYVAHYGLTELGNAIRRYGSMNRKDENLVQYLGFRRLIEIESVRNLSTNPVPQAIKKLESVITRMEGKKNVNIETRWKWDMEFHSTIMKHSGNPLLYALFEPLQEMLLFYQPLGEQDNLGIYDMDRINREHREILKQIKSGNPDKAAAAMEQHIMYNRVFLKDNMAQVQKASSG